MSVLRVPSICNSILFELAMKFEDFGLVSSCPASVALCDFAVNANTSFAKCQGWATSKHLQVTGESRNKELVRLNCVHILQRILNHISV